MEIKTTIGAIVLAAGKGSRMKSKNANKVTLPIADKPMILHIVNRLEEIGINPLVIVVGFAKQSMINLLGETLYFAEQKKRLGTGHAALCGFRKLPRGVNNVVIMYGDDFSYPKEKIQELIAKHIATSSALTFLTVEKKNPFGFGRIIRDASGNLLKIVEEKDATIEEREVKEINPGCFVCTREFLAKYLPKIKKSPVTNEYYLTSLIDLAIKGKEKVETTQAGNIPWQGVNTREELIEAQRLFKTI